jgi:hypothetical protein
LPDIRVGYHHQKYTDIRGWKPPPNISGYPGLETTTKNIRISGLDTTNKDIQISGVGYHHQIYPDIRGWIPPPKKSGYPGLTGTSDQNLVVACVYNTLGKHIQYNHKQKKKNTTYVG